MPPRTNNYINQAFAYCTNYYYIKSYIYSRYTYIRIAAKRLN